jgi:anti-sigma-K factor RskA
MSHDDLPNDQLLPFVFGELSDAEQAAFRKAAAEDAELAATVDGLAAAAAAVRAECTDQVGDDFNARLRQRMPELSAAAATEAVRPTFISRPLTTWRWIMRSRVSRVTAAAILVLTVLGVGLWFHAGGTAPACADFLTPILEAKTARYKMITEMTGASAGTTTTVVTMLGPSRTRSEMEIEVPNLPKSKMLQIWDGYKGKQLSLEPEHKRATVFDYADRPKDNTPKDSDPLGTWRAILLDARKTSNVKREPLGEKNIDGRHVIGFRIASPTGTTDVWGDPKTGMPVHIDVTTRLMPNMKMSMQDFELNVKVDESLFSVEPPAGYKVSIVRLPKPDETSPGEKDLTETLRRYAELSGGTLPDAPNHEVLTEMLYGGLWLFYSLDHSATSNEDRHQKEHTAVGRLFDRCAEFIVLLPKECDAHYAGKDVVLGTANTPVFWYRPKGVKNYRVIYANLTVREAETPPKMPIAKPGLPEKNLIEMILEYAQWNDGKLPNALDRSILLTGFMGKDPLASVPKNQDKRTSAQWKRTAAANLKFMRGIAFINLLPKQADWHYAGKRVSLGTADTPIFWYRPKEAKKYRVMNADLAIREVETPPAMPHVLPEQDLIDLFREYGKHVDGQLPDSLDLEEMMMAYGRKVARELFLDMCTPPDGKLDEEKKRKIHEIEQVIQDITVLQQGSSKGKKPNKEEMAKLEKRAHKLDMDLDNLVDWEKVAPGKKNLTEKQKNHYKDAYAQKFMESRKADIIESTTWIQPGLAFVSSLPPNADAHYAGKGLSLGAADKPIFWYRPKSSKKYRVIYADLSVRDADARPNVPNAEPVPRPTSSKK